MQNEVQKSQRSRFQWDTQNPKTEQLEPEIQGPWILGKTSYKFWPKFLLWKCQCINFGDLIQQMGWGMGWLWRKHNFRGVVGSPKVVCFTQSSEKHKIMIPQSYYQQWLVNSQKDNRAPMIWNTQMFTFFVKLLNKHVSPWICEPKRVFIFFHGNHVSGLRKIWCCFNNGLWRIFFGNIQTYFLKVVCEGYDLLVPTHEKNRRRWELSRIAIDDASLGHT